MNSAVLNMSKASPQSIDTFTTARDDGNVSSKSVNKDSLTPQDQILPETSRSAQQGAKNEEAVKSSPRKSIDPEAKQPGARQSESTESDAKESAGHVSQTDVRLHETTTAVRAQHPARSDASSKREIRGLGITLAGHKAASAEDRHVPEHDNNDEKAIQVKPLSNDPGYFDRTFTRSNPHAGDSPDPEKKLSRAARQTFVPEDDISRLEAGATPREVNTYKYDALPVETGRKVIRVIDIVPRQESALLTLRMRTVDLADKPEYEAISYCWGAPVFDRKVLIDERGVLAITTSLDGVLRQLRDAEQMRTVWADAICINQADIEERNAQVQLMRDVYRNSKRVIAWLGTATTESDVGMDVVPRVITALRKKQINSDPRLLRHVPDAGLMKYGFPQRNSLALKCLFGIFARPWFRRVWIIQELALAPDALLLCGEKSVRWDLFQTATYECWGNLVTFTESNAIKSGWYFADSIIQPTKQEIESGVAPQLVNLVARSSVTFATDPRDKVFALIGLSKERGQVSGVLGAPDYHLSVEEVYSNFAIENIRRYQNLDVLSLAHRTLVDDDGEKSLELPSWVPSFSAVAASDPLTGLDQVTTSDDQATFTHFAATYTSITAAEFSNNNRRIHLRGHIVDVVVVTGDLMHHQTENEDKIAYSQRVHNTFSSWEHVSGARSSRRHPVSPIASPEDQGEKLLDVYWQVINGGLNRGSSAEEREAFETDYLAPIKAYRLASAGQSIKNRDCFQIVERVAGWLQDVQNWWRVQWGDHPAEHLVVPGIANCRRVGRTQTNRICLLPGSARAGDQLALLSGAKVPYVVRKEEEEDLWTLVGEAYVHGIMLGEAWKEENCHDIYLD